MICNKEKATEDAHKVKWFNQIFGIVYKPKFEFTGNHADDINPRILISLCFTTKEVKNELMQIDANKACKPDEIPKKNFQEIVHQH